jgi:hypothetical protein
VVRLARHQAFVLAGQAHPLIPFLVMVGAFGFTVAAMLVPLVSEFDVALGRTTAGGESGRERWGALLMACSP